MDDLIDDFYPEITLETDDIQMTICVKKDYSDIKDFKKRKNEFIQDLHDFIKEFEETSESNNFISYYD